MALADGVALSVSAIEPKSDKGHNMNFHTCDHCAVALVNGDLSGLEYFYGVEDMARIEASIEAMGLVTLVETIDLGSYFECFVCDETCLGEMSTFEPA